MHSKTIEPLRNQAADISMLRYHALAVRKNFGKYQGDLYFTKDSGSLADLQESVWYKLSKHKQPLRLTL